MLAHGEAFSKDGIPGMLSPDAFDLAWHQYQGYLVDRLNKLTAGTLFFCLDLLCPALPRSRLPTPC